MTTSGQFRAAPFSVTFTGQSLGVFPAAPDNYPTVLMGRYTDIPWHNSHVDGLTIAQLTTRAPLDLYPYSKGAITPIGILSEGTSDLVFEGHTAQQMYDEQVVFADAWKAAGIAKVIGTTLVRSEALMNGATNTIRLAFNDLLRSDLSNAFDGLADWAVNATLADYTNDANYPDGIHFSAAAAVIAADVTEPVLDAVMAA